MGGGAPQPSYDEKSYIQDGLVFQLDGIVKGDTAGSWTDLVSKNVLSPQGNPVATDKGWVFDGNSRFYRTRWLQTNNSCTLEVSGIFQSGSTLVIYSWSSNIVLNGNYFYQSNSGRNSYYTTDNLYTNTPFSASMNIDRCVKNKSVSTPMSSSFYQTGYAECSVGRFQSGANSGLVGTIYAIRLYNRKLTEAEQKFNVKVDSVRFGFSL